MSFLLIISCSKPVNEVVDSFKDKREVPTMTTLDVVSLVSDSGITKCKFDTKEWIMYEKAQEPYWLFPKKFYLEQFDSLYNTVASVRGDTAYFYKNKKLWKVIGNVEVINKDNVTFTTDLLYWDQISKKIYSDKFVKIVRDDFVATGQGFESDETMSNYKFTNSTAEIPWQAQPQNLNDSLNSDSLAIEVAINDSLRREDIKNHLPKHEE